MMKELLWKQIPEKYISFNSIIWTNVLKYFYTLILQNLFKITVFIFLLVQKSLAKFVINPFQSRIRLSAVDLWILPDFSGPGSSRLETIFSKPE